MSGPGFFQQNNAAVLTDSPSTVVVPVQTNDDGTLTASLSADAGETQAIEAPAGSAVAGTAVNFPPGTLSVSTTVTMEEGTSLAGSDVASDLGLGGVETSSASTAVVISSSANIDATQPFTVNLALDNSAGLNLTQAQTQLVVFYKIKKVEAGDATFVGIIPNNELTVANGKIAFKTRFFGSYQAVYIPAEVTTVAEKPATKPIETVRETNTSTTGSGTSGGSTGGTGTGSGAGTSTTSSATVELTELTSTGSTDTSVTLSWRVPETVKEFIVVQAPDVTLNGTTATATPPAKCAVASAVRIAATALTANRTVTGLQSYTGYIFKVCAVSLNGNVSDGKNLYVRTRDLPPYDPQSVSVRIESSRTVKFNFFHPANRPWRYRIAYAVGATGGSTPAVPANCTSTASVMEIPTDLNDYNFSEFRSNSWGAFRICGVNRDNAVSGGYAFNAQSGVPPISCDAGTLDTICEINTDKAVPGNTTVAGLGELHIKAGGVLRINSPGRLTIDMKTMVLTEFFPGASYGEISVNYMGHAGGTAGTPGAGPGGGIYHSVSAFAGGGAFGGQGGIQSDLPRSYDSTAYGNYATPMDMGSGGSGGAANTGGSGGGFLEIRTTRLVNNGMITAYGAGAGADAGGGAGGGISIYTKEIWADTGTYGYIKAPGGGGSSSGGGGSGGRIAIHFMSGANSSLANLQIIAPGGGSGLPTQQGGAGTIFLRDMTTNTNELWIAGENAAEPNSTTIARTPVDPASVGPEMRQLQNFKILSTASSWLKTPADFQIQNMFINAGAALDYSGLGYKGYDPGTSTAAQGPAGTPGGNGIGNNSAGGGGGAAGAGAAGAGGAGTQVTSSGGTGGNANSDSDTLPAIAGAGGGGGADSGGVLTARGGDGGAALSLKIGGTLNLNGKIKANGTPGVATAQSICGGGGGGGAIYLEAATIQFNGSAQVEAKGGNGGDVCSSYGGGGGGGRIYLKAGSVDLTVPVCVTLEGSGYITGNPGTATMNIGGTETQCPWPT
jgi:hypothetical protein